MRIQQLQRCKAGHSETETTSQLSGNDLKPHRSSDGDRRLLVKPIRLLPRTGARARWLLSVLLIGGVWWGHQAVRPACLGALSCPPQMEVLSLELEAVTENGTIVDDLSRYSGFAVSLSAWYDGHSLEFVARGPEDDRFRAEYVAGSQ